MFFLISVYLLEITIANGPLVSRYLELETRVIIFTEYAVERSKLSSIGRPALNLTCEPLLSVTR